MHTKKGLALLQANPQAYRANIPFRSDLAGIHPLFERTIPVHHKK
jgi:hypothetical protein